MLEMVDDAPETVRRLLSTECPESMLVVETVRRGLGRHGAVGRLFLDVFVGLSSDAPVEKLYTLIFFMGEQVASAFAGVWVATSESGVSFASERGSVEVCSDGGVLSGSTVVTAVDKGSSWFDGRVGVCGLARMCSGSSEIRALFDGLVFSSRLLSSMICNGH